MGAELKREIELVEERESKGVHMEVENLHRGILKRKDDTERMWGRATEGLVELGKIPGVLAKFERAEKAVEVVKGM